MVVDSSALVAVLLNEPERRAFLARMLIERVKLISVASVLESAIVIEQRLGEAGVQRMDRYMERIGMKAVPIDLEQLALARTAFRQYGKGRHRAGLNFGDCFAYALARQRNLPLLYKGGDFGHTDIMPALA